MTIYKCVAKNNSIVKVAEIEINNKIYLPKGD